MRAALLKSVETLPAGTARLLTSVDILQMRSPARAPRVSCRYAARVPECAQKC
jgi:hypothetical protein